MTMDPKYTRQPGDGGFTDPEVFDTLEEAIAAGTAEDRYLESLDQENGNDDENE